MSRRNDDHEAARSLRRTQFESSHGLKWNRALTPNENSLKRSTLLHQRLRIKHLRATSEERKNHVVNQMAKKKKTFLQIQPQKLELYAADWSSESWDDEFTPPSFPRTFLDNGQLDPFASLAVELPQSFINEGFHLSRLSLIETITNARDKHGPKFANYILSMAVQHESLMYSMINAALMFTRTARGISSESPQELYVHSKAIKLLSEQMSDHKTILQEFNIWSIVTWTYCSEKASIRRGKLPQQSALKELQSLHIYGRLTVVQAHLQALRQIIFMLGGLHKLSSPEMAGVMSFAGLLEASRELKPSSMPFVSITDSYLEDGRLIMAVQEPQWAEPVLDAIGSSFFEVWPNSNDDATTNLLNAICHIRDFTIVLNSYMQGRSFMRTPAVMTDQRNFTQYTLMALPASAELERAGQQCDEQYEPCRLACIVYSFLIIFPLPPVAGLFERLSAKLQKSLCNMCSSLDLNRDRMKLQLWILTMGAVITIGLPERTWFLSEMDPLLQELAVTDAHQFFRLLDGFLWHANTSARDGMDLWRDLQALT